MDNRRSCLAVLVLVTAILGLGEAFEVVSKNKTEMVAEGDDLTLECVVEGDDFEFMETPILFSKGSKRHSIHSNKQIQAPFKATNRYTVDFQGAGYKNGILTITDVTGAEHDKFYCTVGSGFTVEYNIIVPAAIEEVSLTSANEDPESVEKTFMFEADKPSYVHCDVTGGRPKPKVTIWRDGMEDITSSFTVEELELPDTSDEALSNTKYQVSLKNDNFMMSTEYNGQNLTCKANVPVSKKAASSLGVTGLKQIDSANMEINFAPVIKCEEEKEATEGTKFSIQCEVESNPKINLEKILWSFPRGENDTAEIQHLNKASYEDGQYETMTEDFDSKVILIFEIKTFNSSDFRVYTLQVENEIGQVQHKTHVYPKTSTTSTTTDASKGEPGNPGAVGDGENGNGAKNMMGTLVSLVISIALAIIL